MASPAAPTRPAFIDSLETKEAKVHMVLAQNIYVFGDVRPMNRIRAYTSAGLTPFAGRGNPTEFLLLGHVHVDADGKVARVEGFNGLEGERWAKQAGDKVAKLGVLAEKGVVQPMTPLKSCAHTGFK